MTDNAMPDEIWAGRTNGFGQWHEGKDIVSNTRYIRPDAVKVKPLEWLERRNNQIEAGPYQVCCNGSPNDADAMWRVRYHGKVVCKQVKGVDRAVEWANKHYLATINSLLTNATATIGGE